MPEAPSGQEREVDWRVIGHRFCSSCDVAGVGFGLSPGSEVQLAPTAGTTESGAGRRVGVALDDITEAALAGGAGIVATIFGGTKQTVFMRNSRSWIQSCRFSCWRDLSGSWYDLPVVVFRATILWLWCLGSFTPKTWRNLAAVPTLNLRVSVLSNENERKLAMIKLADSTTKVNAHPWSDVSS